MSEPFSAHLYVIPRLLRKVQSALVRVQRRYFENAPHWVLLTTCGRRSGLPRETLLPCGRGTNTLVVISTYGWRANWIKNLRKDPQVSVTWFGTAVPGRAEVVEDIDRKRQIVSAHPFFPPAPFAIVEKLHGPFLVPFLKWWVTSRPIVLIHCPKGVERSSELRV